jgi:hypothetical protein
MAELLEWRMTPSGLAQEKSLMANEEQQKNQFTLDAFPFAGMGFRIGCHQPSSPQLHDRTFITLMKWIAQFEKTPI